MVVSVTLLKTIYELRGNRRYRFSQRQKSSRKDVERAFGVLQARFAVVHGSAKLWNPEKLWEVMTTCVIIQTIFVQDEGDGFRHRLCLKTWVILSIF